MLKEGVVVKSTGSWYTVKLEGGERINCRIVGKFRLEGLKTTNPIAVGDGVRIELEGLTNNGIIKEILPRTNYVVRQSPRKKHQVHFLASNIDQAILIVTIIEPKLKQGFIDRFLLMTEPYDIPVHIVFNKMDLYYEDEIDWYLILSDIYTPLGYNLHLVSAETGQNIDKLKELLEGKISLIAGQSGVGKTSIINNLLPGDALKTSGLSSYSGKGQHTTTFAEMFDLDGGTSIIDTPGIKTLSFSHLEPMDVAHNFREFFDLSSDCKFADCSHRNEPKCAVKKALENQEVSELRYANYLQILDEIEGQNYWELNTDF